MHGEDQDTKRRSLFLLAKAEELERVAEQSNDSAMCESWKLIATEYRRLAEEIERHDNHGRR